MTNHDERIAMSVQQQLGLDSDGPLVQQIRERWSTWSDQVGPLAAVGEFDEFRNWLRTADIEERDDALHALASMAAKDADNDHIAGAALAWALLPGAATLAAQLARFSPYIDSLVAAQLWLEVRSFPWKRRRKVAANVLAATRAGVLLDLAEYSQVRRSDRAWANTDLLYGARLEGEWSSEDGPQVDDHTREMLSVDLTPDPTPAQEVEALLAWGVGEGLISDRDRLVLTQLIDEAETTVPTRARTANCGLGSREITDKVGHRLGVSAATVRRHLNASVTALAGACDRYVA